MRRARCAPTKRCLPMAGSRPSRVKSSAERSRALGLALLAMTVLLASGARGQEQGAGLAPAQTPAPARAAEPARGSLRPYTIVGDAIPDSLTGEKGNAERG